MAILLLCLALGVVSSLCNGHPVQHGSSSYMYKYLEHSPAEPVSHGHHHAHSPVTHAEYQAHSPVTHGDYQALSPVTHGDYQAQTPVTHGEYQAYIPVAHTNYQAHSPVTHVEYQAHSPATHGVFQAYSPAVSVTHDEHQAHSAPLFLPAGYSVAADHVTSAHSEALFANSHVDDTGAEHGHLAVAEGPHSLQGHEHYTGHQAIAAPVVLPSGHLAETQEVADARAHHLSAVAQARANEYYGGKAGAGYGGAYGYSGSVHGYGLPVVLPNGHIADTHEVAAAKSAHLLAVAKAKADKYYEGGEGYGYGGAYGYSGSVHGYGMPVVLPSGHIADTHEVAAAKSAHMVAVAHAKAQEALSGHEEEHGSHYEHHYEHYGAHYEPEFKHGLSHVHYEPHQEIEHESYGVPHNAYAYH